MQAEQWQRVKQAYGEALDLAPQARETYLQHLAAAEPEVAAEVSSLLAASREDSFLGAPAESAALLGDSWAGRRLGAYRVEREIGRGGMGSVYLAVRDDQAYRQTVAIKLVRGGLDSAAILRRFRNERQILAALDHPSIVRLLDGGATPDGRPFLVMEYVEGLPIDEYVSRNALSVARTLRLFEQVCSAVACAHRHLVIHRDLKPGNILVTPDGVPKLLDFGIAKLLDAEWADGAADVTETSTRLLTPDYASPEQVRGEAISTATDVYALGLILYLLLTGEKAVHVATTSALELERAICELEPRRPSSVAPPSRRRALAGELDHIVLTALRKEPARRYGTVEQLAADIGRHLGGFPVLAHGDSLGYRLRKFVSRHLAAVLAAALLLLTLAGGVISTGVAAREARRQRARAEQRFNDVRRLATTLLFEFHDSIQDLQGATAARELVVRRALEYLDGLARESAGEPGLQRELAAAYQKIGDVQGNPSTPNLGNTQAALSSYARALHLRQALAAADPSDPTLRLETAQTHDRMGNLAWNAGDRAGALASYRLALQLREAVLQSGVYDEALAHFLTSSANNVGDLLGELGQGAAAQENYRRGLEVAQQAVERFPRSQRARRDLSVSLNRMGDSAWTASAYPRALEMYTQALQVREALAAESPANAVFRRDLIAANNNVAETLARLGRIPQSLEHYRKAVAIAEALRAGDVNNALASRDLAVSLKQLSATLLEANQPAQAALALHRAAVLLAACRATDPSSAVLKRDAAEVALLAGRAARDSADPARARAEWRVCRSLFEDLGDKDSAAECARRLAQP